MPSSPCCRPWGFRVKVTPKAVKVGVIHPMLSAELLAANGIG
jgi:hypothetical protein